MTPDQATQLSVRIVAIKEQLFTLADSDTRCAADDEEANQMVASLRAQLANIDQQLFGLYRLLHSFASRAAPREYNSLEDLGL